MIEAAEPEPTVASPSLADIRTAFTPHAPVRQRDVFRGRIDQIKSACDAVVTPGLHAVLYGDRGVGKTSLANILGDILEGSIQGIARVNCTSTDRFASVARRALGQIRVDASKNAPGFQPGTIPDSYSLADLLTLDPTPDEVASILHNTAALIVVILDEFDRLPRSESAAVADLIKALSDRGTLASVVVVGVATDVNDLISSHESITRCLRQVSVPTMSDEEIAEIIDGGMDALGMQFAVPETRDRIIEIAQGYPHYAHLLGLHSAEHAAAQLRLQVQGEDLNAGLKQAVRYADQQLRDSYFRAVTGTKASNLWKEAVLACATAERDESGFFSSRAVQDRMSQMLGREVIQQNVAPYLGKLIEDSRGPMLRRVGQERRYRYNFVNPLLRPYILMHAELARLGPGDTLFDQG